MRITALFIVCFLGVCVVPSTAQNAFHNTKFILDKRDKILTHKDNLDRANPRPSDLDSLETTRVADFNQLVKFIQNPFDTTIQLNDSLIRQVFTDIPIIIKKINILHDTMHSREVSIPSLYDIPATKMNGVSGVSLSAIPSASFLSPTQIIDGTALFIKRRVKEELSLAFLDRFRTRLNENESMRLLLPATHRLLQSIAEMDNSLPSLNNIAINAFQSDLETMPENIENTLLYDKNFADIRKDKSFKYFALSLNTIKHVKLGSHPAWVLQDLREKYFTGTSEIDRIIQMMAALNDNLRDTILDGYDSDDNIWISDKQWADLVNKKGAKELFMGLLFQKNKNGIFKDLKTQSPNTIRSTLLAISGNMNDYLLHLKNFEKMHHQIQASTQRAGTDSLALEMGWSILQLVDQSHWLYFSFLDEAKREEAKRQYWNTYKPIAEATLKAVSSVQRKNYAGLMLNSYHILRGLSQIEAWQNGKVFGNEYLKSFFYYGNFMTDVLTASNSEDVAQILERYAAPVGSYSVKRRSTFSLSLNAYPGLFMGWESPKNSELLKDVNRTSFITGVTAPIGLSFNFGGLGEKNNSDSEFDLNDKKYKKKHYQSLSAFVSVIDIGAVLSYRWADDQAQGLPQSIEWAQVIAPGLHLVYGFPNLPLTLNAGVQVAPKLRKVTLDNGNELKNTDFLRFSLALTTDISIFNFYHTGHSRHHKKP
ncbi:MAG: hypothetical protein JNL70_06270 [Saprospiraceae bacterium]|nr:hypothetical protein [Saprospiraceae bacterium]